MFLQIFIIFGIFQSLSAEISCYDCSSLPDTYNYLVTVDTIPKSFGDCPIKSKQDMCYISLRWLFTSEQTGINVGTGDARTKKSSSSSSSSFSSEQLLTAAVDLSGLGANQYLQHSFTYFCSTDKCNDMNTFKKLLQSLIMADQFNDLKDLLVPVEPFDGHWCLMFSNQTASEKCDVEVTVDPKDCKQCSTQYVQDSKESRICAGCFTDGPHTESLLRHVEFNMTDRTFNDSSLISCQSNKCNRPETIQLIQQKSIIKFNFDQFFSIPQGV